MAKEIEAVSEPKNAVIAFRPTGGETTVTLKSTNRFTYRTSDGESHSLLFNIESPMAERTAQPGGGHIGSTLGFKKFDVDILVDDNPMRGRADEVSRAVQHIPQLAIHPQA